MKIVGLSDAPIPWPIGKQRRARSLVVFKGLALAVRRESNQAVANWFGVTPQTVSKWRKALDVRTTNDGTLRLRREHAQTPELIAARAKGAAKNGDPARRAKIAASRRGKPRPPHVIEILRVVNWGKKASAETRAKMSASHRRRGTRPPKAGKPDSGGP